MSRPLTFVLQLIGACLVFLGAPSAMAKEGVGMFALGAALVLIGSIGWRKRKSKT